MEQRSLLYSAVARGSVILTDYENYNYSGNFGDVAGWCLKNVPSSNNRISYHGNGHTFNFLTDNGLTYCVVAVESVGIEVPFAFLERIQESFIKNYSVGKAEDAAFIKNCSVGKAEDAAFIKNCSGGKTEDAALKSLNDKFRDKMRRQMQYCVNHQEELRNLVVKDVTCENIKMILESEENIELVVDFHHPEHYAENMTLTQWLTVMAILLCMVPIMVLSICPAFNCITEC